MCHEVFETLNSFLPPRRQDQNQDNAIENLKISALFSLAFLASWR